MENDTLIPHLFRTEYRRIVSVLCKYFGHDGIDVAEDIASDTFLAASELWGLKGVPANPVAWLHNVARNKCINYLNRNSLFEKKIAPELIQRQTSTDELHIDLSEQNITDSQLQMMFTICHPALSQELQVCLSLRILCGFGIEEIADAFLTNKDTIKKRLLRAKERLREENIEIAVPKSHELDARLESVLSTIYLLFNEGYYSISKNETIRKDLCLEAIRLCYALAENDLTNKPTVNALLALMCFHASRFEARVDTNGELILYEDQDASQWNGELIDQGSIFLNASAKGDQLSKYHVEAAIAWWHTQQTDTAEKWQNVLQLYNQLLIIEYSPIAALNRTFAYAKVHGNKLAIHEAEKLKLENYHLYFALLGVLYTGVDDQRARANFKQAMALAKTEADIKVIQKKVEALDKNDSF